MTRYRITTDNFSGDVEADANNNIFATCIPFQWMLNLNIRTMKSDMIDVEVSHRPKEFERC